MSEEFKEVFDSEVLDEFEEIEEDTRDILPCIPLRGVSILPNTVVHFDIGREKSIKALEKAMANNKIMFVSAQRDENILIPTMNDIYNIGCVVRVKQMLKIQGDAVRVRVEGLCRARIIDPIYDDDSYLACEIERIEENITEDDLSNEDVAAMRVLSEYFVEYASYMQEITDEAVEKVFAKAIPSVVIDKMANELLITYAQKQIIIEELDFSERIRKITDLIADEIEIAKIERVIGQKLKERIDNNQKEYILREKMKAIQEELGVTEDAGAEAIEWMKKLEELNLEEKTYEKVKKEIDKFSKMMGNSAEATVIRNYVETILKMPWNTSSKLQTNLKKAEKILDDDHYGMKKVKERILEYLAVIHLSKAIKGPILCLVGPPGVGKTSIARSIARATGREFVRMSLGGVRDEAEIRGHRRTYIGAIPGRVISCINDAGTNNPLFLFDEVDKIGSDFKGDPASALLEVLDPEQNNTFTDHFLEIPFDLSKVMFITTANSLDTIPRPLLDRMEVIEVSGYTEEEKVKIAQKYLIPKKVKEHGLKKESLKISEKALRDLINYYTRESGVRNLEREIANLCRKVARKIVTGSGKTYNITPSNLEKYLGKHKVHYDMVEGENQVGVTTGMAWTQVGGDTLQIETVAVPGTGKVVLTGQLGDVMQESARAGISYIRSVADKYDINKDFYKDMDLHVHVPEGAVPKDGPSAGVTMCTAIISCLTGIPVRRDVAMTGEITLRGKVLPVGGIREKVLAAHRAGIKKILLPKDNEPDIDEIPQSVKRQLKFVLIDDVTKALDEALVK